jgi:tetratricopeptide (TPR) repeat protein
MDIVSPAPPTTPPKRRNALLPLLCLFLGLALGALALSRWMTRKPPVPPSSASADVLQRYWQDRIKKDVSDKEAYLQLGILEERTGFYFSARRHLDAARSLGVPDTLVCGPLGRALTHLSESERALAELEKAVALLPGKWEPVANLAGYHINDNHSKKANEVLLRFWDGVDKKSLAPQELERLSLAFSESGNNKSAFEVAKLLVETAPDRTGGQILAARSALSAGELPLAKSYVEAALKVTPDESAALYFYGLILSKLKDYDGALKVWQKANQLNPSAPDIYEQIGLEYGRRGDFKRAVSALEQLALANPDSNRAIQVMQAYQKLGDTDNANYWEAVAAGLMHDYAHALTTAQKAAASTDPAKKRRGQTALAEAYLGLGKKQEYFNTIFEATKQETVDDLVLRARAYEVMDKYPERLACLDKIIKLDPKQEANVRYQRSLILEKIGSRDEAEAELEKALKVEPENPTYAKDLASLYFARNSVGGRLEKATVLYEQAVAKLPDQEDIWLALGQCYAAKNLLGKAARCIEHSIDLESGNGPAYLQLGQVYMRAGNTAGSQEMLKLYQKYVTFEQKRQTLQTRARRSDATAAQITEYADLLLNMGATNDAVGQYEKAYALNVKDAQLKNTLRVLYRRLGMTQKLESLEGLAS